MAENKLVGSLILRTIDIAPTRAFPTTITTGPPVVYNPFNNDYGTMTANGGLVTWNNVNIKTCLGELYNNYKKFNLKLTALQMRNNTGNNVIDAQMSVYISGLPLSSDSCYNTSSGPTNQACIGFADFTATNLVGRTTSILSNLVSFDKPQQYIINISIELKNSSTIQTNPLVNGYAEKTTMEIGLWSIMCDIYGIDD